MGTEVGTDGNRWGQHYFMAFSLEVGAEAFPFNARCHDRRAFAKRASDATLGVSSARHFAPSRRRDCRNNEEIRVEIRTNIGQIRQKGTENAKAITNGYWLRRLPLISLWGFKFFPYFGDMPVANCSLVAMVYKTTT